MASWWTWVIRAFQETVAVAPSAAVSLTTSVAMCCVRAYRSIASAVCPANAPLPSPAPMGLWVCTSSVKYARAHSSSNFRSSRERKNRLTSRLSASWSVRLVLVVIIQASDLIRG